MPTKDKEKASQQARDRMRRMRAKNVTPNVTPDPLEAINMVLEGKGIPKVRKGVEPILPFDKKLQASRKRM